MNYPGNASMTPIGILMIEHRLIERVVKIMNNELADIEKNKRVKPSFIDIAVDFIRTYADKCHHGKEEDIFFKKLLEKELSKKDKGYVLELIEEHKQGRATVGRLVDAKDSYLDKKDNALGGVIDCIKWLIDFYPKHIKKEDDYFFDLYKEYLNEEEQDKMLSDFLQFSKEPLHDKYSGLVESLEKKKL